LDGRITFSLFFECHLLKFSNVSTSFAADRSHELQYKEANLHCREPREVSYKPKSVVSSTYNEDTSVQVCVDKCFLSSRWRGPLDRLPSKFLVLRKKTDKLKMQEDIGN
jgi:hypothetical protein